MKPLIRWIVGPVSNQGLEILDKSIVLFSRLYPDLDLMVCYNQIDFNRIDYLKKYGVSFYNQEEYKGIKIQAVDEIWKIYPPRLRLNSCEIIIDNDLVIFKRVKEIDDFLNRQNVNLILSGRGSGRYYGQYDALVPESYVLSSGIYGFYPGFDFDFIVQDICKKNKKWKQNRRKSWYDDQGIIAHAALRDECIIIPQTSIFNFNLRMQENVVPKGVCGIHFVCANIYRHYGWENFKTNRYAKIYI